MATTVDAQLPWWPLPRKIRRLGALFSAITISVLIALIATAWNVGSQPVSGTGELAAQLQAMTAAIQTLLAFGLAMTTVFYAIQTWAMVNEMRLSRLEDAAARRDSDERRRQLRTQSAVLALTAAADGVLGAAAMLATYLKLAKRPWFRRQLPRPWAVLEPIHQRLLEASGAVDQIRACNDEVRLGLALELYDVLSDVYATARTGASSERMEEFGHQLFALKQALRIGIGNDELVAGPMEPRDRAASAR